MKYSEDLYENKEDVLRHTYLKERSNILQPNRPFTSSVKQRGTFERERDTFGLDREFRSVRIYPIFFMLLLETIIKEYASGIWTF